MYGHMGALSMPASARGGYSGMPAVLTGQSMTDTAAVHPQESAHQASLPFVANGPDPSPEMSENRVKIYHFLAFWDPSLAGGNTVFEQNGHLWPFMAILRHFGQFQGKTVVVLAKIHENPAKNH